MDVRGVPIFAHISVCLFVYFRMTPAIKVYGNGMAGSLTTLTCVDQATDEHIFSFTRVSSNLFRPGAI